VTEVYLGKDELDAVVAAVSPATAPSAPCSTCRSEVPQARPVGVIARTARQDDADARISGLVPLRGGAMTLEAVPSAPAAHSHVEQGIAHVRKPACFRG